MHSTEVRQLYDLGNDPPDEPRTRLTPHMVITTPLTVFPVRTPHPHDCFVITDLYLSPLPLPHPILSFLVQKEINT